MKLLGGGMGELGATGWLFEFGKLKAEAWSLQGRRWWGSILLGYTASLQQVDN